MFWIPFIIIISSFSFLFIFRKFFIDDIPHLDVDLEDLEQSHAMGNNNPNNHISQNDHIIRCYDPSTMDILGFEPVMDENEVKECVQKARKAQSLWKSSSFDQRRLLLRTFLKYIVDHQDIICKISAQDSGKAIVDAEFGEIFTTCEKISWLISEGEKWLLPEQRSVGRLMPHKTARVEYSPLGVIGAIVPWNYPFHNIFNPMLSSIFAGNAIVIKASEHVAWSSKLFERIIHSALKACSAPIDLVQIITGYGETGAALVDSGVDKLIFVGSTEIGKMIMANASKSLTPLTLELGGKDCFIVLDDADLEQVVPIAMRGVFQCCGQNCVGAERFYVQSNIHDEFVKRILTQVNAMRLGIPLEGNCDMGSMCMPCEDERMRALVEDAMDKGATLACGGLKACKEERISKGQFFPPTVLLNVDHSMAVMQDEVFGPIMPIMKFESDEEVIGLANACKFGLGSAVFSSSKKRTNHISSQLDVGMVSVNDFASTYMCQSLPFGGLKESGYGRFAGIEGLRACCNVKSIVEDRFSFIKTHIPKPLQYPISNVGVKFQEALVRLVYGMSFRNRFDSIFTLLWCLLQARKANCKNKKEA